MKPGLYGLSNHVLNTPWPKVEKGRIGLAKIIQNEEILPEQLFELVADTDIAPDENLPDTGIPLEWERRLSAMFIKSPGYGTRVSTVLLLSRAGNVYFEERAFVPKGEASIFRFEIED